jgi:hypothetical protein
MRVRCVQAAWLGIGSLLLGGCASSSAPARVEALRGCWYFEQDEAARQIRLPWGVELMLDTLEGWPAVQALEGVRRAATLTPAGARDFPLGYWRPSAAGDSVELGHPGGGGLAVEVAVPPQNASSPVLTGTVRPVGDVLRPDGPGAAIEPRPVRLARARCP